MTTVHTAAYRHLLERLRLAREAAGMTQTQVARALGRPQSFVSKCESGARRVDAIELMQMAQLYGRSIDYFVAAEAADRAGASLAADGPVAGSREKGRRRSPRRKRRRN